MKNSNLTCTGFSSKEGKIDLEILFADVLDRNKGFPDQTNVHNYYRIAILVIFPNRLPLVYIEKLKFDLSLFLVKIDQEILFADSRWKERFSRLKTSILHTYYTSDFPKGLTHGLSWKMKFDLSLLFIKIDLEILFSDVLDRNKGFPD